MIWENTTISFKSLAQIAFIGPSLSFLEIVSNFTNINQKLFLFNSKTSWRWSDMATQSLRVNQLSFLFF